MNIKIPKYENDLTEQSKESHFQYTNWVYLQYSFDILKFSLVRSV